MEAIEMAERMEWTVEEQEDKSRVDRFLADATEEFSREYLAGLIGEGRVTVNGETVKKNHRLQPGDQVVLEVPAPQPVQIRPQPMDLSILYEDEDLVVVDKQKGLVVHPAPGNLEGTLVNGLLAHCRDLSGINGVLRPGIVHRIDKDTSGLLVVAKNDRAHSELARQFKEHTIERVYLALVHGQIQEAAGEVEAPIGRDPRDRKRMAVNGQHGKDALTRYRVLERFPGYSLVELRLETGRTHQIRVHMKLLDHPLVGDEKYTNRKNPFGVSGQMLHAGALGFEHPRTGQIMRFQSPLPAYFQDVLDTLEPGRGSADRTQERSPK